MFCGVQGMSGEAIAAWLTVAGVVLAVGRRYVWRPCYRGVVKVRTALQQVETMHTALGPNGGKSLGDNIRAIDARTQVTDARIDLLLDLQDALIFECAPTGENVRINESFTRMFGYSPAEMLGKRWIRILHPDDRERFMEEWAHAIDDKRVFRSQARYVTRAGVVVEVEVIAEPHPHALTGDILRWRGRVVPLAAERKAQP